MGELLLEPSQCWLQWQELVTLHTELRTAWACSDGPLLLLCMCCPLAPELEGWARKGSCCTIPRGRGQEVPPLKTGLLLRAQEKAAVQCICPPSLEGRALQTGSLQQPCAAPSVSRPAQGTHWHWLRHRPCPVSCLQHPPPLHTAGWGCHSPCPGGSAGLSSPSRAGLCQVALARTG